MKKWFKPLVVVAFAFVLCGIFNTNIKVNANATTNESSAYYYNQLDEMGKKFYVAMQKMDNDGMFKTGTQSLDLSTNDAYVTQAQLLDYSKGSRELVNAMGAGRDAFVADNPEIFYVDFSYLSLRVTMDSNGIYHAHLGVGRSDNYLRPTAKTFDSIDAEIEKLNQKVEEIGTQAKTYATVKEQVEYVHNAVLNSTTYKLEDAASEGKADFVRTAYGALVCGESVCEGYSRAIKMVLDNLNIPCILVQGGFAHTQNQIELHMWNYVKLDDKWYGLDATMDDANDSIPSKKYLLVGAPIMDKQHMPSKVFSESNYEFEHPELNILNVNESVVFEDSNFNITTEIVNVDNLEQTRFRVGYLGKGYKKLAESGYYLLSRWYMEDASGVIVGAWGYMDPTAYMGLIDTDTYLEFTNASAYAIEFAITLVKPISSNPLRFLGDPAQFVEQSDLIQNECERYVKPPYIKSITPDNRGRMVTGKTYHVEVEYDENLTNPNQVEPTITLVGVNSATAENSKVENFVWDHTNPSKVSFDFTPSRMFADDTTVVSFYINGLVGEFSNKKPNTIGFYISHPRHCSIYNPAGIKWDVFGKPQLIENADLSMTNWKDKDGNPVSTQLKHQLALITTTPTNAETTKMEQLVDNEISDTILKTETYNISLTLCKQQVVEAGDGVRVSVGFPEGYSYSDIYNTTFKAYHFIKDETGDIVDVEEIECVVTEYGLIVTCKEFSPFAIVVVDKYTAAGRRLIVTNTDGGVVVGEKSVIITYATPQSYVFNANPGYQIESITLSGEKIEVTNKTTMSFQATGSNIIGRTSFLHVDFAPISVIEKEEQLGLSKVQVVASDPIITFDTQVIEIAEGEKLEIKPNVSNFGIATYRWYKDGIELAGETNKDLIINEIKTINAGTYILDVETYSNGGYKRVRSQAVTVTVTNSNADNDNITNKHEGWIIGLSIGALVIIVVGTVLIIVLNKRK